jgi:hypothetical protein
MPFGGNEFDSSVRVQRRAVKDSRMKKKAVSRQQQDDVRREYDFRGGKRGKYAASATRGSNVVVLDPDVASVFRDSGSVNEALRVLLKAARGARRKKAS